MKVRSKGKVKQQQRVLLVALYLLKRLEGAANPPKRRVLRFIQSNHLVHIRPEDEEMREAGEPIWAHDLSWQRNALKNNGSIRMPEIGIWQITEHGERDVEQWAKRVKEHVESKPKWVNDFKLHSSPEAEFDDEFHYEYYITEETVRWGVKIATTGI
ncbi:MAG: hypothetical protein JWM68_205 [Verrucomicrobiales bacterium]|nr:hypothetical protein [Verrucomicrobiales bacterium]